MADNTGYFKTYEEFWPHYLHQHSKRETRLIHMAGIFLGVCSVIKGILSLKIGWILLATIIGYAFAWTAHAFIEQNQPATFEYPVWSVRADFQMTRMWLLGQLPDELARYEIRT